MSGKIEVTIHTARPGLVIGKKGAEIDILKQELKKLTGKEIWIEVEEIKRPDLDAKLVAEGIAKQLERRIPFRRVMKKAMQATWMLVLQELKSKSLDVSAEQKLREQNGIKKEEFLCIRCELKSIMRMGRAETTYGSIGVKVWINKGEEQL